LQEGREGVDIEKKLVEECLRASLSLSVGLSLSFSLFLPLSSSLSLSSSSSLSLSSSTAREHLCSQGKAAPLKCESCESCRLPCCVFYICIFTSNKYPNVKQLSWAINYWLPIFTPLSRLLRKLRPKGFAIFCVQQLSSKNTTCGQGEFEYPT